MTYSHDAIGGEDMYRENVLEHYRAPSNTGTLPDATFAHRELNQSCGDTVDMYVKLEGDKIADVKFQGTGCAISQAATSMLTEKMMGLSTAELAAMQQKDIEELLGFPVGMTRVRCALLGLRTAQTGLQIHNDGKQ
jgi:nitrogen fixation protein NifU and related proteins